jgi:hypothetical protein
LVAQSLMARGLLGVSFALSSYQRRFAAAGHRGAGTQKRQTT